MKTPVAFFIYKRSDCAGKVWAEIRKARPPVVLVVADGPKAESERSACEAVRAIVEQADWPCEIRRNYAMSNLGCRRRLVTGLDWVFQQVEEAVILEDDCLPDQSFFGYCERLLDKYRDEPRVMHIGGASFDGWHLPRRASYRFTQYVHVWGWATWRRAWKLYDPDMKAWGRIDQERLLSHTCNSRTEQEYWRRMFSLVARGGLDTWDYQWMLSCWIHGALATVPKRNLVANIGSASSSRDPDAASSGVIVKTSGVAFPLVHPVRIDKDKWADRRVFWTAIEGNSTIAARFVKLACMKLVRSLSARFRAGVS